MSNSIRDLDIFIILNFFDDFKTYDILKIDNLSDFKNKDEIIEFLLNESLIVKKEDSITKESISKKYTVSQLKDVLRKNNLNVSGKKNELVERVFPVLSKNADDFEVTELGKKYLIDNEWINLYQFALAAFDFDDYAEYAKTSDKNMLDTAFEYIDGFISDSLLVNHFGMFIDAISAKALIHAYNQDYDSYLDYDLQRFILGLNPIVMDYNTYANYQIIDPANIHNIKNVIENIGGMGLKKRFNKVWLKSNVKNVIVPKKTTFKFLKKALSGEDIEDLNLEIKEKYFYKKFQK